MNFHQEGFSISFDVADTQTTDIIPITIPTIGRHNMENALACIAVADLLGVSIQQCAQALKTYGGIYRRHQLLGEKNGISVN